MTTRFQVASEPAVLPDAMSPMPTIAKISARELGKPTVTVNASTPLSHAINQR